jgi:hypothetical protein
MKLINSAIVCLLASNAAATTEDSTTQSNNLRASNNNSSRQLQTSRKTDWVNIHNDKRKKYQVQYGGTYSSIKWSNGLNTLAKTMAKNMAKNNCDYQAPSNSDYGMTYYKSMMSTKVPTVSKAMSSWEGTLSQGYPANGAMTQVLWSATKYVGCADAYNGDAMCYATVCLYAKVS